MSGRHKHPRRTIAGLTPQEYQHQHQHAQSLGMTWSEWVRDVLRRAARRAPVPATSESPAVSSGAVKWRK